MTADDVRAIEEKYPFLAGGGEMGRLIREKDWSCTPAGDPSTWPQSLRTTLGIILNSGFPMFLWWGPELICFYNDAYRPSLGNEGKHPAILGMPAAQAWPEIWTIIKPLIDHVLDGKGSTWSEDQLIPIYRNGKIEDVYWTFSYSPLRDERDQISGVIVTCTETTLKVLTRVELEESYEELAFAVDAAELGTWDYNPATKQFTSNERFRQMFGLEGSDADPKTSFDSIVESDRERVRNSIREALTFESGGKYHAEFSLIHPKTKELKHLKVRGRTHFREDHTPYRFNGTLQDLTEEVESRKMIQESEIRFRTMAEGSDLLISVQSESGEPEYFNEAWAKVTGRPLQDLLTRGWEDLLHPADRENHLKTYRQALAKQSSFTSEFRLKSKDGNYVWILMTSPPRFLRNESFAGFVTSGIDITERKRVEEALLLSERRFRNTVKDAPVGIIILEGENYNVETVNNNYLMLVDRKESDLLNKPFFDIIPETKDAVAPLLQSVMETGRPYYGTEFRVPLFRHGKEEITYFNFVYQPLKDERHKYSRIMVVAYEVTESVKAKMLLLESEKQFRDLVNQSPIPMTIFRGPEFTIEIANPIMFEKIWRKKEENVVGRKLLDVFPELENQPYPEILKRVYNNGETFRGNESLAWVQGDDGLRKFFLDVEYSPLFEQDRSISGIIVTVNDVTEKVEARHKVEESEKRFRNVADSAPVLVWMAGPDNRCNYFNTAWLNFTGRSVAEESGTGWMEGVHPDDLDHCRNIYEDAFRERTEFYVEFRLRRADGVYRWVSDKGVPRITNNGIFEGFIGACMDIHDQVVYQQKLKHDEERLNIIIEASELGTWEFHWKTRNIIYSERLLNIFGLKKEDHPVHEQLLAAIHPDDMAVRERAFVHAVKNGILHYESRIIWPDGSIHWMESKGKLFYDENGQPDKLIGTTREITREKNYQKELQDREEKFRLLADSMPQFVWTTDKNGLINYNNQSLYLYSGLSQTELSGENWLDLLHPDDREEHLVKWNHSLETGTDFTFEHRFRRHDGQYRWQLSRAVPQRNAVGEITMWVGSSTDIQEMKELDQQKDYFISMASHELKTPITSIKGYVQMLQALHKKGNDEFLKKSLRVIDKQVVSLTGLISDLLDLSKIKSGTLFFEKTVFDVNELTREIIEEMVPIQPEYSIIFSEKENAFINADRERIGQVLRNFLTNAVKYSPDGKEVHVSIVVKGNEVQVSVKDSGIGISKAEQQKVFDRFYRVEGKSEKTYPGFGIGLFIASEIIRRHDGKIGVISEPGKGAEFYFTLPKSTAVINE